LCRKRFFCRQQEDELERVALVSKDFLVSSNSRDDDPHFTSYIGCPAVHGDAECPLVSTFQLFISQTWIGWVCGEPFELFPKFDSDFFGKVVQPFQNGVGDDDVSRQSVFGPLLQI